MHSGISRFTTLSLQANGTSRANSYDRSNVKAYSTYGTSRINAYKIIEETLNLKDVRIFDYIEDDEGKKKACSQ